jgi:hypothetical protein
MRLEPLLRAFFFWLTDPTDLHRHLEAEASYFRQRAALYGEYAERKERGEFGTSPATQAMRIAIEGGVRMYEALAEWARDYRGLR